MENTFESNDIESMVLSLVRDIYKRDPLCVSLMGLSYSRFSSYLATEVNSVLEAISDKSEFKTGYRTIRSEYVGAFIKAITRVLRENSTEAVLTRKLMLDLFLKISLDQRRALLAGILVHHVKSSLVESTKFACWFHPVAADVVDVNDEMRDDMIVALQHLS